MRSRLHLLALAGAFAPALAAAAPADYGRPLLDTRIRLESLDQGASDALALTARARFGWETPKVANLVGLIEAEGVAVLIDDYADGVRPNPGRQTIPDAEILELNRAQVTWTGLPRTEVVLGRQRIVLNNARFIGNSGWRQNEQTFDALKLTTRPTDAVAVTYAYIGRVLRTSGRDHPQGEWEGDVHLMQTKAGKLSGYGYLMDFETVPAQSSATYGVRFTGARPVRGELSATWELEYARQSDWGNSPTGFDLDYVLVAGGLKTPKSSLGLVYERLGGDGRRGFQTPLGTTHGFQGRSDVIGATPAAGIRDLYLRGAATLDLGRPVKLTGELHDFRDEDGERRFGQELDAAATLALTKQVSMEAGAAWFASDGPTYPDATRAWLTLEYKY
jgi:hypothetical protein